MLNKGHIRQSQGKEFSPPSSSRTRIIVLQSYKEPTTHSTNIIADFSLPKYNLPKRFKIGGPLGRGEVRDL